MLLSERVGDLVVEGAPVGEQLEHVLVEPDDLGDVGAELLREDVRVEVEAHRVLQVREAVVGV